MNYIYTQSSNYMFKNLIQKVFDFFISGTNRSVIAICFLMSLLFWFLIKFSKEYTYYIDYPIEFINQPIDKYWKDEPLSNLKVKVNGHGFNFLKETFSNRLLKVDVSKLQNTNSSTYFWLSQAERSNIAIELFFKLPTFSRRPGTAFIFSTDLRILLSFMLLLFAARIDIKRFLIWILPINWVFKW